jgi:hypothetical protein
MSKFDAPKSEVWWFHAVTEPPLNHAMQGGFGGEWCANKASSEFRLGSNRLTSHRTVVVVSRRKEEVGELRDVKI